jgi:small subunit ribosomal protein S17
MADEPDNDAPETPDNAEGQAPEVEAPDTEAAVAPETEASEATTAPAVDTEAEAAEAEDTTAPDTDTPEAEAVEETTDEPPATPAPAAGGSESGSAPPALEQLSSKERRRKARSTHTGEARATRSPEERHSERLVERRKKAVRRRTRRLKERAKAAERRAKAPAAEPLAPVHTPVEGTRKVRQGVVVSNKADKTITVRIDTARRHRRYEKIVRSSSTLHAHDEENDAHEGDTVRVIESRPLSRLKRWKLVDVVERAR